MTTIETTLRLCGATEELTTEADPTPRHSIGEVAEATGLSAHTLRWYERIGLLDPVDRSHSGQRRYSDVDLRRLGFLNRLRLTGMPVADMLRYVELLRAGEHTLADRRELLIEHREDIRRQLSDLHATLAVLDFKVDLYARALDDQQTRSQQCSSSTSSPPSRSVAAAG